MKNAKIFVARIMKIIKNIILFVWQFPQTAIGLVVLIAALLINRPARIRTVGGRAIFYFNKLPLPASGISLGYIVFVQIIYFQYEGENTSLIAEEIVTEITKHELGHCRQSAMLGILYLPIWAILSAYSLLFECKKKYHDRVFEAWADRLAEKIIYFFSFLLDNVLQLAYIIYRN